MKNFIAALGAIVLLAGAASAHDTWLQTNPNVLRIGDRAHIDLMLGNHGNDHRDFKLAGKLDLAATTLHVLAPDGKHYDLKDKLVDLGYAPKEGYWTTRFTADKAGLYLVPQTSDKVVHFAPVRSIKSEKSTLWRQKAW